MKSACLVQAEDLAPSTRVCIVPGVMTSVGLTQAFHCCKTQSDCHDRVLNMNILAPLEAELRHHSSGHRVDMPKRKGVANADCNMGGNIFLVTKV